MKDGNMQCENTMSAAIAIAALLAATTGFASESRATVEFDATVGADYDSNVGIAELDQSSGAADSVVNLGAGVTAVIKAGDHVGFRLGYEYSGSRYRQFSEFDLGLQHAVAEASVSSRILDAALTAERFDGRLDGEPYLTVTQYSPNVSKLIGGRVFLRAAFIASDKQFDALPGRNARAAAYRVDTYLLLDGMDRYVALAWQSNDENTDSAELDFHGHQAALTLGNRFVSSRVLLKTQLRYEQRDYLNVTEAIDEPRRDRRLRACVTASMPIGRHFSLDAKAERTLNSSNFGPADLDKFLGGLELKAKF
jgi:hypothetical protein